MKVINSLFRTYQEQLPQNIELKEKVDEILKTNKKERWHYFSRIKSIESYALKIESGRFIPYAIEDFFGCTLVVENSVELNNAKELIIKFFKIIEQRPNSDDYTFKNPESFPFDDLRLYVKILPKDDMPPESPYNKLSDILFEIQIKTFLQHAWSIATHDLIYKGDEISWAKQRVAYQIKAMLEHAEVSIYEINSIKNSKIIAKVNKKIQYLSKIKEFVTMNWSLEELPKDFVKLSENVLELLECLNISIHDMQTYLDVETCAGRGTKTLDLSPYFILIQTIINQKPKKLDDFFKDSTKFSKIVIPKEVDSKSIAINPNKVISL